MTSFNASPKFSQQVLMLTTGIFLIATTQGAVARDGGHSNDRGGMSSSDFSRNNADHDRTKSSESNRDRDHGDNYSQKHNDREQDKYSGKHEGNGSDRAEKTSDKNKTPGTITASKNPPAPGTSGTNTIHPIPAPTVNLPPPTHGGNPPRGPVAAAPGAPAVVSNGEVKLYIPNSPSGLSVTSNKSGTITVSNGDPTHSVTLPGGSVTISGGGVTSVGGAPGVQVITHPNGDFVAAATPPAPNVPAPPPGHVTGGPEGGFLNALGSGLKDLVDPSFTAKVPAENVKPPLATSTVIQP